MHPVLALERYGGVARRQDLIPLTTARELSASVLAGDIVRDARGRYSLVDTDDARRTANMLTGVLSHTNAALHWGWPVKVVPTRPHVTVRRKRRLSADQQLLVVPHWRDLAQADVVDAVTSRERTLLDCITDLPFDEALSVADSALRAGAISSRRLATLAATARGNGARQARRVAAHAHRRAANPFESVLRATAINVKGLDVTPQLVIETPRLTAQPDLVDPRRRVVLGADSHTWHSSRAALRRDCTRYNALVLARWIVLRFTWEQVMFEPADVRSCLEDVVALTDRQARRTKPRPRTV
jgi:very-short-patch-repair endonuclease